MKDPLAGFAVLIVALAAIAVLAWAGLSVDKHFAQEPTLERTRP